MFFTKREPKEITREKIKCIVLDVLRDLNDSEFELMMQSANIYRMADAEVQRLHDEKEAELERELANDLSELDYEEAGDDN